MCLHFGQKARSAFPGPSFNLGLKESSKKLVPDLSKRVCATNNLERRMLSLP